MATRRPGVDGVDHDRAVVRDAAPGRPGVGQAARLPGAACDQLPARRTRRALPDDAARVRWPAVYPSRSKDPDPVDYSTGSVGIGATAPIWGAMARRYVDNARIGGAGHAAGSTRWSAMRNSTRAPSGRRSWTPRRGTRRDRLDRRPEPAVAGPRGAEHRRDPTGADVHRGRMAGHHRQVGRLLRAQFVRPGGAALRARIVEMSNPEYQRLLRCTATQLRDRLPGDGPGAGRSRR